MNDQPAVPPGPEAGPEAVLAELLQIAHLLEPDDLPAAVTRMAVRAGARSTRIYLADHEQHELRPLAEPGGDPGEPQTIDGTVAGKVYTTGERLELDEGEQRRLVLPLLDGTHRLGVLEVCLPPSGGGTAGGWESFASLVAGIVLSKSHYGDTIEVSRRMRPMALRAEAQRRLLPPLTLTSLRVAVTGVLVPSYEVAGDLFDFALNGDTLHLAVFDAMGHSLGATLTAAVAVAAYRNARREGGSLVDCWRKADKAVATEFGGERFATAVLVQVDLVSGRVRTVSAGHPSALVVRDNRVIARCADEPTLPLGLEGEEPRVTGRDLQPGDRLLLFTDGIVEARSAAGEFFGEGRLVDELGQKLDGGLPAPEAVRQLVKEVFDHQSGKLSDDATLVLAEWRGRAK